jgi:hypothetical protein
MSSYDYLFHLEALKLHNQKEDANKNQNAQRNRKKV